jgi:Skp family chaperone for outer membrane proteins
VFTAGLLAVGLAGYFGSQLRAQQGGTAPARPAAEPRTRVAIINVNYVFRNYDKFKTFQEELKAEFKTYETRAQPKQKQMEASAAQAQDPKLTPEQREAALREAQRIKRELEDLAADAKMALTKKEAEQMVILYREIQDIAHRYALAHNFDLVMTYNEAVTQADYYSPANIQRKLNAVGLMPLYYDPGLDISQQVMIALNASYRSTAPQAGTPPVPTSGARPVGN